MKAVWRPRWPPLSRNFCASWKLSLSTLRASIRPVGISAPSLLSSSPIFPSGITVNGAMSTPYCQGHIFQYKPGASVLAWKPASPLVAIIRPSGKPRFGPTTTNFFVTRPILFSGTITIPKKTRSINLYKIMNSTIKAIHHQLAIKEEMFIKEVLRFYVVKVIVIAHIVNALRKCGTVYTLAGVTC